jgi:spore coat protein CotH
MKLLASSMAAIATSSATTSWFGASPIASNFQSFSPSTTFGTTSFGTTSSAWSPSTFGSSFSTGASAFTPTSFSAFPTAQSSIWDSFSTPSLTSSYTPTTSSFSWPSDTTTDAIYGDYYGEQIKGNDASYPFDQNVVRKYNIEISQSDIRTLNGDISAEEYVPCSITTDYQSGYDTTYQGTGCRYKGAVGSLLRCLDSKTGRPNGECRKLSFKVDANKYRDDDQKIDGNKRLNFHGMAVDKALVTERTMYNAMRELGIAAPRAAHAELYVNGKFDGIYVLVEDVNTPFSKHNFGTDINEGKGAIYKDVWFLPEQMNTYSLDEHLTSGDEQHQFMMEIYNQLPYMDCATFESYFDIDSIAKITAFNDLIGQTDDWRYRHNLYWYVKDDGYSKKLVLIPWDYDRIDDQNGGLQARRQRVATWANSKPGTYKCSNNSPDPSVAGLAYATGFERTYLTRMSKGLPPGVNKPIECDDITQKISQCGYDKVKSYFNQYKAQMSPSAFAARIDQYKNQIASSVAQDSSVQNYEWSNGIASLKRFLQNAPAMAPTKGGYGSFGSSFGSTFGTLGATQLTGGLGSLFASGGLGQTTVTRGGVSQFSPRFGQTQQLSSFGSLGSLGSFSSFGRR